jgi:hypothetical protein
MASNWLFLLLAIHAQLFCSYNKDCYSGCCMSTTCVSDSYCSDLQNDGGYCSFGSQCKSGRCSSYNCAYSSDNYCYSSSDCLSGCCSDNYCAPTSYCTTSSKEEGEYCLSNPECANSICYKDYCDSNYTSLYGNSWYCSKGSDCISGCCIASNCTASSNSSCAGNSLIQYCEYDYECDTHECVNGLCKGIVDYNSGSVKFILIGLPFIGIAAIVIGIIVMLKCCTKFLVASNVATPQPQAAATQAALNLQVTNI